jgi:hypothetical protein
MRKKRSHSLYLSPLRREVEVENVVFEYGGQAGLARGQIVSRPGVRVISY